MGLKLRDNLFYGVAAEAVYAELASFWAGRDRRLRPGPIRHPPDRAFDEYVLHRPDGGWTMLGWDGGWEWDLRRQAQLHVSRALDCAGLLVFVYDGDYWGYELFAGGSVVDNFVQDPAEADWFPGADCTGRPDVFAAQFPAAHLRAPDIAPYLVPMPEDWDARDSWDVPARAGDEFSRGAECAVLDFLRMLGVGVELRDYGGRRYVTPLAPPLTAFTVAESRPPST